MKLLSIDCGIKNLAYCVISLDKDTKDMSITDWNIINLTNDNVKNNFYYTSEKLIEELTEKFILGTNFEPFDYVLIENQPVHKNPIMKSIQIVIYTFFCTINHLYGYDTKVRLVSACNKLKVKYKPNSEIAKNYKEKKLQSIEFTRHYLQIVFQDKINLERFDTEKKKDDLADCFLQCVQYIEKNMP